MTGEILPRTQWQLLEEHLWSVADMAGQFGNKFGAGEWARFAGLWHDLGKFHPDFQQMLADVRDGLAKRRVDHSSAGAIHADAVLASSLKHLTHGVIARLPLVVTAAVAGHHGGLPAGVNELRERLRDRGQLYDDVVRQAIRPDILRPVDKIPPPPAPLVARRATAAAPPPDEPLLRLDFLVRMVFSALVDADRLDAECVTEAAVPRERSSAKLRGSYSSISELCQRVDLAIDTKVCMLQPEDMSPTERRVHAYRQAILAACRSAADAAPGAFALDVDTGGGKTLSSLSFALRHATQYGKDRVIVVIPYTSIIEQTAAEYRKTLGDLSYNLIEHHSVASEDYERSDETQSTSREAELRRLATENWDAPIIVTTAVQFFESLLACSPSKCRKLHNVVNSVVVFDEAQTLPPGLLDPTVWLLNELVEAYGVTTVLSTATQPALEPPFPEVRGLRRIVPEDLPRPPRRVRVEWAADGAIEWTTLAAQLARYPAVLCITHQRRDARELTESLDRVLADPDTIHLSANMCAAHRSLLIQEIRQRLASGAVCRVVSTQLVEAGVDLDFPVVFRSVAGVDSLAQAAGRANREGRLGERGGLLRVYRPRTDPPFGLPRLARDSAETMFRAAAALRAEIDIFDPVVAREFFRNYFGKVSDKDQGIRADRKEFRFQTVAAKYRFVDDPSLPIVIVWGDDARRAVDDVRVDGPSAARMRRLQRYTVGVFPSTWKSLWEAGALEPLLVSDVGDARLVVLRDLETHYSSRFGLEPVTPLAPENFVI